MSYVVESVLVRLNKYLTEVHSDRPRVAFKKYRRKRVPWWIVLDEGMSLLKVGFLPFSIYAYSQEITTFASLRIQFFSRQYCICPIEKIEWQRYSIRYSTPITACFYQFKIPSLLAIRKNGIESFTVVFAKIMLSSHFICQKYSSPVCFHGNFSQFQLILKNRCTNAS